MKTKILAVSALLLVTACKDEPMDPRIVFFANLSDLCGKSFAGALVSTDAVDADIAKEELVMHVASCSESEIRIPFHVGDNRSRTWIITRTDSGLRLKHQHNHEDGSADISTNYGGDTTYRGTYIRQEFPADAYSKDLFIRTNIPNSANNVWAVEVDPGKIYAYEMKRENRLFRVEFDLSQEIATPPAAW